MCIIHLLNTIKLELINRQIFNMKTNGFLTRPQWTEKKFILLQIIQENRQMKNKKWIQTKLKILFSFINMATFQAKPFGQSDFKRTLGFLIEIRPSLRLGNTHTVLHKIVRYSPNSTFLFWGIFHNKFYEFGDMEIRVMHWGLCEWIGCHSINQ